VVVTYLVLCLHRLESVMWWYLLLEGRELWFVNCWV
jgi:hypothetical protein